MPSGTLPQQHDSHTAATANAPRPTRLTRETSRPSSPATRRNNPAALLEPADTAGIASYSVRSGRAGQSNLPSLPMRARHPEGRAHPGKMARPGEMGRLPAKQTYIRGEKTRASGFCRNHLRSLTCIDPESRPFPSCPLMLCRLRRYDGKTCEIGTVCHSGSRCKEHHVVFIVRPRCPRPLCAGKGRVSLPPLRADATERGLRRAESRYGRGWH